MKVAVALDLSEVELSEIFTTEQKAFMEEIGTPAPDYNVVYLSFLADEAMQRFLERYVNDPDLREGINEGFWRMVVNRRKVSREHG